MPYWCTDCRSYFSVRTGTPIARSNVPLRKWAIAIYLCLTSLKSVSSMKLHRDIGVSQRTAWFMLHRIREAWVGEGDGPFDGPVEFDETYVGGKRKNMSNAKRKAASGRGPVDMVAVVGAKDRATNKVNAKVIESTDKDTLHDFVADNAEPDAVVSTAAGICTGAAAQKCTTGSVVACPRSPWEGPARGSTRPPRGWRRPARGRGLWAHAGKRGVIRTVAGVVTGSA